MLRYYFPGKRERSIPQIGEWLLKLGCLHAGVAPKEGSYEEAAKYLFEDNGGDSDAVPKNLVEVLRGRRLGAEAGRGHGIAESLDAAELASGPRSRRHQIALSGDR